jgi:transposase InsO family protein
MLSCRRLRHGRRVWVAFGVAANPTAEWIARQITEAFPRDDAPRYLVRDRDSSYGPAVMQSLRAMGIRDKPIAPRSPWQNAYVERLIGSIRRECLDHMIVFGEAHLRQILGAYAACYNKSRTYRSLNKGSVPPHKGSRRRWRGPMASNALLVWVRCSAASVRRSPKILQVLFQRLLAGLT